MFALHKYFKALQEQNRFKQEKRNSKSCTTVHRLFVISLLEQFKMERDDGILATSLPNPSTIKTAICCFYVYKVAHNGADAANFSFTTSNLYANARCHKTIRK